jgi:hypothetical protein
MKVIEESESGINEERMKYDNLRAEYDQKVKDLLNTIDQKEVGKP